DGIRGKLVTGVQTCALPILYDALRDPGERDALTTVDRSGIRTHRFFTPSYSAAELCAARDAIARWARLTYGFMGRTPDYKASFRSEERRVGEVTTPGDGGT